MSGVVRLRPADRELALMAVRQNPAVNVFVNSRIQNALRNRLADGEVWASTSATSPSLLYVGGNAVPVELPSGNHQVEMAFAALLAEELPPIGSIVGPIKAVNGIWEKLEPAWPTPARLIRQSQPYMASTQRFNVPVNRVRWGNITDLSDYFEAAEDMFKSEVGMTPPTISFQSRISTSLRNEQSIGWFDSAGRVNFKLDLGAQADGWLQLQGIWLHPDLRGQGLSVGLMQEAFTLIQRRFDSKLCLYVNDFNLAAIAAYKKLGFQVIEEFATVFF
jgi:uncharacterized protein